MDTPITEGLAARHNRAKQVAGVPIKALTRLKAAAAAAAMLLVLTTVSCYYDNEEELYELYYASSPCDTSQVTFSGTVFPIIQGNCAVSGCHVAGGSGPGLMENYNQIKFFVDNGRLEARALVQRDMPPSGPLTDCQQNQLRAWLSAGAPDN
jgi:hypothetical protein